MASVTLSAEFLDFPFREPTDIDKALKSPSTSTLVDERVSTYQPINVDEAMRHLANVGDLLRLAYSGCIGLPCSVEIMKLLTTYQPLVGDSLVTTNSFVQVSLTALKLHKAALVVVEKDCNKAVQLLSTCAQHAARMAEMSHDLVVKAEAMCNQASEALVAATKDQVTTEEERKAIESEISTLKATEAKLTTLVADLTTEIAEEKARELKAAKEARDARNKAFILGLVSAVSSCVTSIGLNLAKTNPETAIPAVILSSLIDKKNQISEEQTNLMKSLDEAKQKLAEKKEELEKLISFNSDDSKKENISSITFKHDPQKKNDSSQSKKMEAGSTSAENPKSDPNSSLPSDSEKMAELTKEVETLSQDIQNKEKAVNDTADKLTTISNELLQEEKNAQDREEKIAQRRAELQKEQREANSQLAEAVQKLQSDEIAGNDLKKTINSLIVTIKSLGRIKNVFENTRLFWVGMESECAALEDLTVVQYFAELDFKDELIEEIEESGLEWLALAKINRLANSAMSDVYKGVGKIFDNLPSKEEGLLLIDTISASILTELENENKLLLENTTEVGTSGAN